MASRLLASVLLLSALAAVASATDFTIAGGRPWPWSPNCLPGRAVPIYALPRCRAYIKRTCTGGEIVPVYDDVLKQCCDQVSSLSDQSPCSCPGLYLMVGSMYREMGVDPRDKKEYLYGRCPRDDLKFIAASIPVTCRKYTHNSEPACEAVLRDY